MNGHTLQPASEYDLVQTTAPAARAVTAAELREHLRLDGTEQDTYLETLIDTATESIEGEADRQLITAGWTLTLDGFWGPGGIEMPRAPLQSVTAITYTDTAGATQTLASSAYRAVTLAEIGRIHTAYGQSLPSLRAEPRNVSIVYEAGYGDAASDVPAAAKHMIKLIAAHLYENAEAVAAGTMSRIPDTAQRLLGSFTARRAT
jgi:uncharacterized phiE125 gp8 family phage protein